MIEPAREGEGSSRSQGWWSREHTLLVVLVIATALLIYLCWLIALPFLGPLTWALALAVVAHPLHSWIARRVRNANLAAGLAVVAIALVIVAPAALVIHNIVREAEGGLKAIQPIFESGQWREQLAANPRLAPVLSVLDQQADLGAQIKAVIGDLGARFSKVLAGSAWMVMELLLTLFVLFFFFRDRQAALETVRSLVPLSNKEANSIFMRTADTLHATIYGTLVVALVQGILGGLMFWWLGLPAPLLWGAVMALLAVVPVLGAFVVWVPAALFLALNGQMGKALILVAWGTVVIATADNLLYPVLVGKRLRLHTLLVFIAVVGGLAMFGAVGVVLGPLILALTDAIIEVWRRRTADGNAA